MSEVKEITICENCQSQMQGKFCSHCGQAPHLRRIDGKYIISEISSVLNFDKGIFYTIRELLIRPGKNVHNFIHRDRNRLVKPIIFIIITSLIYMVAEQAFRFEQGYIAAGGFDDSAGAKIFQWIQGNYGYSNILMAFFIAAWIKFFFSKYEYNFFEILILLCFVMGIGMLMYAVFGVLEGITRAGVLQIGGLIGVGYAAWAIGQFFDKSKKINYLKGFSAYMLGMITFFLGAIALGMAIDWVNGV